MQAMEFYAEPLNWDLFDHDLAEDLEMSIDTVAGMLDMLTVVLEEKFNIEDIESASTMEGLYAIMKGIKSCWPKTE